uniref:EF-hand domain-containing protein n=1 Tax=Plectus sambesii TaxID=2011161 RepID=A0A914VE69_9BILA
MLFNHCLALWTCFAVYSRHVHSAPLMDNDIISEELGSGELSSEEFTIDSDFEPSVEETDAEQFERTDADGNGVISFDEFLKFDKFDLEIMHAEFDNVDKNGDGSLDESETEAYNAEWRQVEEKWIDEQVDYTITDYDKDDDSKLEESEVLRYLRNFYMLKPKGNFGDVFDTFDKNGDKGLDRDEMENFYENIPYDDLDYIESEGE